MKDSSLYRQLSTEAIHPRAAELDQMSIDQIVGLMLAEEKNAQKAAYAARHEVAQAAKMIHRALGQGGRLFYVGAGTSGRLGAIDAAELPPTFGSDPGQVLAVIAGGPPAMLRSIEGAEDRTHGSTRKLAAFKLGPRDVVCAIAASGMTPFSRAALSFARKRGAKSVFVTCVRDPGHRKLADVVIAAEVGPELLAGSTRLKAGTATKMILNALSTSTMIKLGKVYSGRMVDVLASNRKLRDRARRIVMELAAVGEKTARNLLSRARGKPKLAIAMEWLDVPRDEAERRLVAADQNLRVLGKSQATANQAAQKISKGPDTTARKRPVAARKRVR